MEIDEILDHVRRLEGTLVLAPDAGSEFPEIARGDFFVYYAPDGEVPSNQQPFTTIVTKDYPDEPSSGLDPDGRWRVNIQVGKEVFADLTGQAADEVTTTDVTEPDVVLPHPVYARQGWVSVVNPGAQTTSTVLELITEAHAAAVARASRLGQGLRRDGG